MRVATLLVCAALAATAAGCASGRGPVAGPPGSAPPATTPAPTTPPVTTPAPTTASTAASGTTTGPTTTTPGTTPGTGPTTTRPPTTSTTAAPPPALLRRGDSGTAVLALQQNLSALGYWPGPVDGEFGDTTEQAVFAVQKAAGLVPDGVAGPLTRAALDRRVEPHPQSTQGQVIEVDLEHQLLMLVDGGRLRYTLNTSTGGGYTYTSEGVTAVAVTPRGHFSVFRQVDGMVISPLGELWRPKFFYAGYALHGSPSVPPQPVSHGCVRISNQAIDWIWSTALAPLGTQVWVY